MDESLDCNTEKGRIYTAIQLICREKMEKALKIEVVSTDIKKSADIDVLLIKNNNLIGLGEIKTREMRVIRFGKPDCLLVENGRKHNSLLITYNKLEKLKHLCRSLRVPGFLFVSLLHSNRIAWWKICDDLGNYTCDIKREHTRTQATCNGGSIIRENANISVKGMNLLAIPKNTNNTDANLIN
jgi:hypothetical protein